MNFFFQESGQYLTVLIVLRRAVKILSGFGLSMNGQHVFCGDFIFSGHTMIFLLCYLVIIECKNSLFFYKIFNDTCFFCEKWFHEFFALFFRYFQKTLHITLAGMDKCHHWCYSFTHGSRSLLHWCNFGLLDHNSTLVRDFMKKKHSFFPHSTFYVISRIIFN